MKERMTVRSDITPRDPEDRVIDENSRTARKEKMLTNHSPIRVAATDADHEDTEQCSALAQVI